MMFADTNGFDVWVAVVAVAAAAVPLLIGQRNIHKSQKDIKAKVYTNHGKTPAEYLEMIEGVNSTVTVVVKEQARIRRDLQELVVLLNDHTVSDLHNFNALANLIQEKADK